ncbi:MAG: BLUF domain-containing protein [Polyangiaceae bacterium]
MSSLLYEVVYVSAARRPFLPSELVATLQKARLRNTADGISGMLLHANGTFMQALEGPESAVKATFARIKNDARHQDVLRLFEGAIRERTFAEWSMGFVESHDPSVKRMRGFNDFMQSGIFKGTDSKDTSRLLMLADQFRKGRWRQPVSHSAR